MHVHRFMLACGCVIPANMVDGSSPAVTDIQTGMHNCDGQTPLHLLRCFGAGYSCAVRAMGLLQTRALRANRLCPLVSAHLAKTRTQFQKIKTPVGKISDDSRFKKTRDGGALRAAFVPTDRFGSSCYVDFRRFRQPHSNRLTDHYVQLVAFALDRG